MKEFKDIIITEKFSSAYELTEFCKNFNYDCFAVIFTFDSNFEWNDNFTEKQELYKLILKIPYITAIADENINRLPTELIMMYDVRFSAYEMKINSDEAEKISCFDFYERYKFLYGKNALYQLMKNDEQKNINTDCAVILPLNENKSNFADIACEALKIWFRDKNYMQIKSILKCFKSSENNNYEKVLKEESRQFYKIIKQKTEGNL